MDLPKICNHEPRTKAGAIRQYSAILRAYKRAYEGGGMFGFDWPTMRINWPEGYERAQRVLRMTGDLPEVRS